MGEREGGTPSHGSDRAARRKPRQATASPSSDSPVEPRHQRQKLSRVGLLRIGKERLGLATSTSLPSFITPTRSQICRTTPVVRDEQHREVQMLLQIL